MYQPPHRRGSRPPSGTNDEDRPHVPRKFSGRGAVVNGTGGIDGAVGDTSFPRPPRPVGTSSLPLPRSQVSRDTDVLPQLPEGFVSVRHGAPSLSLPAMGSARLEGDERFHGRPHAHRFSSTPVPAAPGSRPGGTLNYRRYSPAPSEMELLASVSRSGGDGAEGDALKDFGTQMRFRAYIDEKIHQFHHSEEQGAVQNIVLLFRKLREGIIASGRLDFFAIEAFESSVRYAVIARDAPQLLSALSGLVPDLYLAVDAAIADRKAQGVPELFADKLELMIKMKEACEKLQSPGSGHAHKTGCNHKGCVGVGHQQPRSPVAGLDAPDNRSHFASLLLLYHLVHSPRFVFWDTYRSLVYPPKRTLKQRDYKAELLETVEGTSWTRVTTVPPPPCTLEPFTTPENLTFARFAERELAPESFNPRRYRGMVTDEGAHPDVEHDHPEALELALLAWAEPRVREMAGERLRRAYMTVSAAWVSDVLHLGGPDYVTVWALANGASVKDGVVKLR